MRSIDQSGKDKGTLSRLAILASFGMLLFVPPAFAEDFTLEQGVQYIHPSGGISASTPGALGPQALGALAPASSYSPPVFHNGDTMECPQCHTMHASLQHPHDGEPSPDPFGAFPQSFTPTSKLLKETDPVTLCLTCHDGQAGTPDVLKSDTNGLTERSAGYFGDVGEANFRGHKLEVGLDTGPGFGLCLRCHFGGTFATAAVSCVDCHNPHGNGRVRNLQWASSPGAEPTQFGLFMANSALGNLGRYEAADVGYGTENTHDLREVTNMCLDCHHVFSGGTYIDPDSDGIHSRHPTYDSLKARRTRTTGRTGPGPDSRIPPEFVS
jgi:hypothetical protein